MRLSQFIAHQLNESDEKIGNEKEFREFAMAKMKAVFKDKLDEERAKFTIDGFIKNNKKKVEAGEWGELVGMFNQSFAG